MKIKRYKKVNKHLNFYINNFNFRKPYQVLIDGTFSLAALKNKVNIADNLPRYLQGEIKLITTQCIIIEIENLGAKLGGALHVLKQYTIHKCGHEGQAIPASKCLLTMVKNRNTNHYCIATQDRELQDKIRTTIGVPLIYLHGKTPILDEPSEKSLLLIKEKSRNLSSLELERIERLKHETGLDKVDEVKRPKRKRPKAPNPLSCKKKKKKSEQARPDTSRVEKKVKRKKIRIPQHVKEELLKKTHEIVYKKPRSRLIRIILAEFMGTALLIFITCTGCTFAKDLSTLQLCFNSGLAVMTVIQIFGHISGAHVNPAVTLCSLIMGETNLIELPFYVIPQIIASIAGYAVVIAVTPREYLADGHCVNMPHYAVSPLQALVVEILATMIMCLAVCSSWDRQNSNRLDSISLRIGCLVAVINMAVGQYTGASMNPVRSLGPAVWNRKLAHHWIYWLGPIIGGSISGFLYKNIFKSHLP